MQNHRKSIQPLLGTLYSVAMDRSMPVSILHNDDHVADTTRKQSLGVIYMATDNGTLEIPTHWHISLEFL